MPTEIVPAASLRNLTRLPAARVLVWAYNCLRLMWLWSVGGAIFRVGADFLPALREGRTAKQPSTSRNLGRRRSLAGGMLGEKLLDAGSCRGQRRTLLPLRNELAIREQLRKLLGDRVGMRFVIACQDEAR